LPRTKAHKGALIGLATTLAVSVAGCSGSGVTSASSQSGPCKPAKAVTIAYQPGLGYAALLVAKQEKTLEKAMPGTKVKWLQLNSGSAIRDGILAGKIQVGSGGIGPFLVGYDAGVPWKVITGLNDMNLYLMTMKSNIHNLKDLKGAGSIAMPAPDSIQAVILRKGAEEQLGDAKALDSQIVSMGHPDGVQALTAGQIAAHLTSPPFQAQEAKQGAHRILASYDLFGEHTFNSVYSETRFAKCNPKFVDNLIKTVSAANTELTNEPAKAATVLAKQMGEPASEVQDQITADDVKFTETPKGFGKFAQFMQSIDLIKKVPATKDLFFDSKATAGAS
jgi:NitT/TauT family transport system substrate-binding protein